MLLILNIHITDALNDSNYINSQRSALQNINNNNNYNDLLTQITNRRSLFKKYYNIKEFEKFIDDINEKKNYQVQFVRNFSFLKI